MAQREVKTPKGMCLRMKALEALIFRTKVYAFLFDLFLESFRASALTLPWYSNRPWLSLHPSQWKEFFSKDSRNSRVHMLLEVSLQGKCASWVRRKRVIMFNTSFILKCNIYKWRFMGMQNDKRTLLKCWESVFLLWKWITEISSLDTLQHIK